MQNPRGEDHDREHQEDADDCRADPRLPLDRKGERNGEQQDVRHTQPRESGRSLRFGHVGNIGAPSGYGQAFPQVELVRFVLFDARSYEIFERARLPA